MAIAAMADILHQALQGGYAVGYFESWDQYSLEAALEAAESVRSPAIIGFGGAVVSQDWLEGRGLEELATLTRCLAERSAVPTAIMLNEVNTVDQVRRGLECGCNAVMLQTSHLPFAENVRLSQRIVELARGFGAAVEAELGQLAEAGSIASDIAIATNPDEAARFVSATGVDALAVSIGNIHLLASGEAHVDLELLAQIHQAVSIPLVVHGGTGFPGSAVRPAIRSGVAKFNVGTRLKQVFLDGMSDAIATLQPPVDFHRAVGSRRAGDVLDAGKARMKQEIVNWTKLYGSAGQAEHWRSEQRVLGGVNR